jgi:hypothetical protein
MSSKLDMKAHTPTPSQIVSIGSESIIAPASRQLCFHISFSLALLKRMQVAILAHSVLQVIVAKSVKMQVAVVRLDFRKKPPCKTLSSTENAGFAG